VFVSPANQNLRDTLVRLNLCSDRDFRRGRRAVRRLARGIPAFDFVWIDALAQIGALTHFQAKVLQSAPPDQLRIGPCVLLDRLGFGENLETYRALGPDRQVLVVKRLRPAHEEMARIVDALGQCIAKTRGLESPHIRAPHALFDQSGAVVLLSRHVAGPSCKELLVRRGRFPPAVVVEIARQLAHGIAALEARGCLHGQIRLSNVRITSAGNVVIVDAGIGGALGNTLLIRDDVSPDTYDAIAPERIGTGNPLTTASEIYAFGCLLWQLLAGRPPFPTGDPLAKLAAHQSRGVPDVRQWGPDTPAPLAEALRAFTHADPQQRPATFAAIARRFGIPTPTGKKRLITFLRRFDGAAPPDQLVIRQRARFPTATVALLLFVLSGAALFLLQHGATAELLRLRTAPAENTTAADTLERADGIPAVLNASERESQLATRAGGLGRSQRRPDLQPLPTPNSDGFVQLQGGSYEAEAVNCAGDLAIRGPKSNAATIIVSDQPFRIGCRKFSMEHVTIRRTAHATSGALMKIHSQEMALDGCAFMDERRSEDPTVAGIARSNSETAIEWSAAPARDPDAGRIRLANSIFASGPTGVRFVTSPSRIEIDNCLMAGGGMFDFGEWTADRQVTLLAQHLTVRQGQHLCCLSSAPFCHRPAQLRIVLRDSAFDLAGPAASLIRLTSLGDPSKAARSIQVTGRDSIIRPEIPIFAWTKPGVGQVKSLDSRSLVIEGLAVGDFQFVGHGRSPASYAIDCGSLAIPRQSDEPPGIIAERLADAFQESRR
jgi:eukaryotic-like serine/threonine-protein kinase